MTTVEPAAPTRGRPRLRARPPIRPPERVPLHRLVVRAGQLFLVSVQLLFFLVADRFVGGDALARELLRARRLRSSLERLGGVFVKVGQLLSVRTDQFPWEVCREFANLLDHVVPFPGATAKGILEEELQAPVDEVFTRVELEPIAAASIGQVHVGWLRSNGKKVAIKIQRPGVAERTAIDLRLLRFFARMLDTVNITSGQRLTPMIDELRRIMDEELSYINEARATDDFRRTLKKRKHVYSPKVYFECTTDRVLTMEFVEGLPASALIKAIEGQDHEALDRFERLGLDRRKLAKRFYRAILQQIYEHDIVHSDPHPGNLILMPKNKICFIDFGAVGYFGPTFRAKMERVTAAFGRLDVEAAVDATLASWEPLPLRDVDRFKEELKPVYQRMLNNAASKHGDPSLKSNGRMFMESAKLASKYGINAPWDHLRFTRLLWEFDTTVVALNPDFDFRKAVLAYFRDRGRRAFKANLKGEHIKTFAAGMINLMATMPQDVNELRFQAFNMMRRSDHLYVRSMSKVSYIAKFAVEYAMLGFVSATAVLGYFRAAHGAPAVDEWLREHLPVPLPWWAWLLLLVYTTVTLQRLRLHVTEIDNR